ncbi:hypothetical protein HMPREF9374_1684 [Desmospora sp. 8437]|nr:hypothetical protein HMPREF9374_1684 [Desmospora sp. 8437]
MPGNGSVNILCRLSAVRKDTLPRSEADFGGKKKDVRRGTSLD